MFLKPIDIAPARITGLLRAAEAAARSIPPDFPLSATVAVNPFLGQTGEDLATAAARLALVAGVAIPRPRIELAAEVAAGRITDDDLTAALIASASPLKPADLGLLKAKLVASAPAPRSTLRRFIIISVAPTLFPHTLPMAASPFARIYASPAAGALLSVAWPGCSRQPLTRP